MNWLIRILLLCLVCGVGWGKNVDGPAYVDGVTKREQYAHFPKPMAGLDSEGGTILETIRARAAADPFNVAATLIFFGAILHTFMVGRFNHLAHYYEEKHRHERGERPMMMPEGVDTVSFRATLFHFLGEVEVVFGLWVLVLAAAACYYYSWADFQLYINKDCVFVEPLFVVVIMVIASTRPILKFSERLLARFARLGKDTPTAWWVTVLIVAPLLGSFVTEPAAMTIAALLLARKFYRYQPSSRLAYGTLGLLFVNVSVGGTLTHFAAPPVLMVAGKWGWGIAYMLENFGWKVVVGIVLSTTAYYLYFRKDLYALSDRADGVEDGVVGEIKWEERNERIPIWVTMVHLVALVWTVYTAHYPALFIGGFLFFIGFTVATQHHQNPISMKSPILVGFFLAGLVVHGGCQGWWISPVIQALDEKLLMFGAMGLTAFNDNAAVTFLASQVDGISDLSKQAVVAGAVVGGGLTVIANAPNPAGQSILGRFFHDGVSPLKLFLGALIPTAIVYVCLLYLPNLGESSKVTKGHEEKVGQEQTQH